MMMKPLILQITNSSTWKSDPNLGFLTPTVSPITEETSSRLVYGAVRDTYGRGVIRSLNILDNGSGVINETISLDRRGSNGFDTDGTILGHVDLVNGRLRMFYIGFKRSKKVKFEAFSGLAESQDGRVFRFKQRIFHEVPFSFLEGKAPDIVACHWNNLNQEGDGLALVAIGTDWLKVLNTTFPKYSSYLIEAKGFEFKSLICKIPQRPSLYRLGRPRFITLRNRQLIVATGGKVDGDYRPYFFEFKHGLISASSEVFFPVSPGDDPRCQFHVSYPEILRFGSGVDLALFNGDRMGIEGCLGVSINSWLTTLDI